MNMIERFEVAHRHFKVLSALGRTLGADSLAGISYRESSDHFSVEVYVLPKADEVQAHAKELTAGKLYQVSEIYGATRQFEISWTEPRCEHCKQRPLAYEGAKFCGAGCTAKHEAKHCHIDESGHCSRCGRTMGEAMQAYGRCEGKQP